jgi:transmembrane sensor
MSNPGAENKSLSANAKDVQLRAAEWIAERHEAGEWTDEDQAALDAWLAESPAHLLAYWRLDAAWTRTHTLAEARGAPLDARARLHLPLLMKIAAVFAVIAVLGFGAVDYAFTPHDRTYSTPVGGHETVSFADGSRIELNTNTVLHARMTTDQRIVWLEKGEAYFQVKHDPAHPFIVMAGDHRVTDLGTKFTVRRETGRLQVAVLQGRVWLDETGKQEKPHAPQSAMLTPGDFATATPNSISVTRKSEAQLAGSLSWRHGVLVFKYATLAAAVAEFNRYNREQLVIADPEAARLTIVGTFPTNQVDAFIDAAQTIFGLKVKPRGNEIVISR